MKKTIKRNNIKVPAYEGGTPGVGGSSAGKGLTAAQVGAIGQGAVAVGGMLANSLFGTSTAATSSQVAAQTAGDIFSGMGQGASIGSAFGGWGAAIGGAAGAVLGAIGQKGREAEMVSFTDYDQGTLGTGLMGAFGANRRLRRERNRIKSNAYANRAAVEGTENLAYEFAQENTMGGVNSFKDGGQVKKPVYMSSPYDLMAGGQEIATDTKEVGYNPQTGEIKINPKYGKEGSDLIHRIAQPGEYWFGKLVNPETGNTFKEDARSIIKKGEVKGARAKFQDKRTAEINNNNRLEQLDVLADAQNRVHQEQNTKPKVKRSVLAGANGMQVPAYEDGLSPEEAEKRRQEIENYFKSIGQNIYGWFDKSGKWLWNHSTLNPNAKQYVNANQFVSELGSTFSENFQKDLDALRNGPTQQIVEDRLGRKHIVPSSIVSENKDTKPIGTKSTNSQQRTLTEQQINETFGSRDKALGRYDLPIIGGYHSFDNLGLFNGYGPMFDTSLEVPVDETQMPIVAANVKANTKPTSSVSTTSTIPAAEGSKAAMRDFYLNTYDIANTRPDFQIPSSEYPTPLKKVGDIRVDYEERMKRQQEPEKAPKDYSWIGDLAGTIGQLAVAIPGLGAKPETAKFYRDPSWNASRNALLSTINNDEIVKQALPEQSKQRSISNYNLARTSANTGRNLGAMTQTAVNSANAVVDARIRQKLANDQALQAYSDMMHAYGKEHQAEEVRVSEANAANRAAALMTNDAARKSIHNILAGSTKSYNTKLRDKQLLPLYRRFLEAGFTHEDLAPLYS